VLLLANGAVATEPFTHRKGKQIIMSQSAECYLSSTMVRRLMRQNGVTIRSLAEKNQITMERIREVRANGVSGFVASNWHFMITGIWLDTID